MRAAERWRGGNHTHTQTVVVLSLAALWLKISLKKDTERTVTVEEKDLSTGDDVKKQYTFREYDHKQLLATAGKLGLQLAMTCGIYYKFGYAQPLLIQAVMQPMNLLSEPLIQIHFLGKDDTVAPNKRPFKVDKPPGTSPRTVPL